MRLFELLESTEPEITAYAEAHGLGEIWWEGSGDFGHAYRTEKGTILKTTGDKSELKFAAMLVGKDLDHVVKIYDVSGSIIHMEWVDTAGIDDLYFEANNYEEDFLPLDALDPRDYPDMPPRVVRFINEISIGMMELEHLGIRNADLKEDHIGKRADGSYAIFDISAGAVGNWG